MQISCPQCGKMLESPYPIPERAQCPFCAAVFTPTPLVPPPAQPPPPPVIHSTTPFAPPTASFEPPSIVAQANDRVRIPAIGMMIGGILSMLYALIDLVFCIHLLIGFQQGAPPPNLPPFMQNLFQPNPTQMTVEAIFDGVKMVACIVIIYGSIKMLRLESYGLAVTSSVISVIPCIACCCFLGIPFGIWSLVVLNRPEVRATFR